MKWLILCIPLLGCGPSCEEQGGHWVQHGSYYGWQTIGSGTYLQEYPDYICVKEKNK